MYNEENRGTWSVRYNSVNVDRENNTINIIDVAENIISFNLDMVWLYDTGNSINMILGDVMFIFNI
jgi:heme oxygenase